MAERVLSERELGRALLERQSLLARRRVSLPEAVERMGGVQAQYAPSIYIGLWSRVEGLERDQVTRALERRTVVQATLLRNTIHLVSPGGLLAAHRRDARRAPRLAGCRRARSAGPRTKEVEAAPRRMRACPADGAADRKELMPLARGRPAALQRRDALARRGARASVGHLGAPPRGHLRAGRGWLGRERRGATRPHTGRCATCAPSAPPRHRHRELGRDPAGGAVKPAARETGLRRFRDERDRVLLDVPRGLLPDPSTHAPVRFLPTWDATLLVNVAPRGHPPRALPAAALQHEDAAVEAVVHRGRRRGRQLAGGEGAGEVEPFEPLPRAARREVDEEARRLEAFLG